MLKYAPEKFASAAIGSADMQESIQWQMESYRGRWSDQLSHRGMVSLMMQTLGFFFFIFWRAGGLMLIGMALYRWGVFSARRSNGFYLALLAAGVLIGIPLCTLGVQAGWSVDWNPLKVKFLTSLLLCLRTLYSLPMSSLHSNTP